MTASGMLSSCRTWTGYELMTHPDNGRGRSGRRPRLRRRRRGSPSLGPRAPSLDDNGQEQISWPLSFTLQKMIFVPIWMFLGRLFWLDTLPNCALFGVRFGLL